MANAIPLPRNESRWGPALAIVAVLVLLAVLPRHVQIMPAWVSYVVTLAVLVPMAAITFQVGDIHFWLRAERAVIVLFGGAYVVNTTLELADMIGIISLGPPETRAATLLSSSLSIWVTNVLSFALLYWQIDRGGPAARESGRTCPTGSFHKRRRRMSLRRGGGHSSSTTSRWPTTQQPPSARQMSYR